MEWLFYIAIVFVESKWDKIIWIWIVFLLKTFIDVFL